MTTRQRALAVLRYEPYDRLPVFHFGFWEETLAKWHQEGHLTREEADGWSDGNAYDDSISKKLGFDANWSNCYHPETSLYPEFTREVLEALPDGTRKVRNRLGVTELEKDGAGSIPAEVDTLLKDRQSWEEHYRPRLQYTPARIDRETLARIPPPASRENPVGLFCGSLFGEIRNWLGVEGISYLPYDDEDLLDEILDTVGNLCFRLVRETLDTGVTFDFAHFWEDICFKNGPLVVPSLFAQKVGPYYKKINDLLTARGIDIISLDCDGCIDALLPIWLANGVNTMFPIEVGTWNASITPWRAQYGKKLLGVGGMNKTVFAGERADIDREIERLKPLIALGGYLPCPDHRIAPDAKWELVQYYCEQFRKLS